MAVSFPGIRLCPCVPGGAPGVHTFVEDFFGLVGTTGAKTDVGQGGVGFNLNVL